MKNVLISNGIKETKKEMFNEIERILFEKLGDGNFEVCSRSEFMNKTDSEKEDFWNNMRFVVLHTDDRVGFDFRDAFEKAIPIILVRGENIKDPEEWSEYLRVCGMAEGDEIKPNCLKKMIYYIEETDDIRGAIRWVNNYYYALKRRLDKKLEKKSAEEKELLSKILKG